MNGVEHATTDEARVGEGLNEKPRVQEAATNSATREHSLVPQDDPGRPTRSRQAPRWLPDYVRAVHEETIEQSPTVLEHVERDSKLTREPGCIIPICTRFRTQNRFDWLLKG